MATGQQPSRLRTGDPTGTYAADTRRLPVAGGDGCWLEAARVAIDSVHLQMLCRYPAPGHHLGVLEARVPLSGDSAIVDRRQASGSCRIRIQFADSSAHVVQHGTDVACGLGASVNLSGTYIRLNRRRPPFDLVPIERAPAARRGA